MKQAHVFVSGFVQGVGYRQFVKQQARRSGVFGWVRNLPDGRVEAVLQGGRKEVEKVVEVCRKGPFLSEVEYVDVVWEEGEEEAFTFSVSN